MKQKTTKKLIFILLLFVTILILIVFTNTKKENSFRKICSEKVCFNFYVADEQIERITGLINFDKLEENEAMLFIFEEEARHSFWMKDMKFSIDIIWLDSQMKVVHIEKNLLPCTNDCEIYNPQENSKYALEINANLTEKYEIKIGDTFFIQT